MENIFKDEALVLRRSLVGEYDLSITVYFRKHGKENIYIPKGQLLKSPLLTPTEHFNWFKGVFIYRRDKVFIREIDRYKNLALEIAKDLSIFNTAFFFTDIFNRYVLFPDERLFIFLKKSLYYLTKTKNVKNHRINFLVKLIYLSGVSPQLDSCSVCGTKISKTNFKGFSSKHSGLICSKCFSDSVNPYLNFEDIRILKTLEKISFKKIEDIKIKNPEKLEVFLRGYLKESM
ncbi:DNA repair protein RecO [Persephonella sp.]